MSASPGPDLPPRPRPNVKPPTPTATKSGPPTPSPRGGGAVSALAKNFGGVLSNGPPPSAPSTTTRSNSATAPPPLPPAQTRPSPPRPREPPPHRAPSPALPSPLPAQPPQLPPSRSMSNSSPVSPPAVPTTTTRSSSGSTEGFGSCLQNNYDIINQRHEDELLALESLRNHVFSRSRFDKEYSDNLTKTNMKASRKMNSVSNVNKSSAIIQVWMCFLEMSENLQRHVSNGAAQMSGVLLHTVDQLIRDKRGAKAAFDQEKARMDSEFTTSCKIVQELRRTYLSGLKITESNKKKLELALAKDPPRLADQEKYRKKFVQNAEKLHSTHNDYSLSLTNANIHIDHHRSSLTPFCLDTLQQRMELQITQWKDALTNYTLAIDMTKVYEEQFERLYERLEQVAQDQEYVEFIRVNRKEQPPIEYYEFDTSLLSEPSAPEVEPGKVVVNNITYHSLKMRLSALETETEQHNKEIEEKREELNTLMCSLDEPLSPTKETHPKLPRHVQLSKLKGRLNDLDCLVAREQQQTQLITSAVGEMEEDAAPLFHELGDGVDPKDLDMTQALSASATVLSGKKRGMTFSNKMSTIKSGFRKFGGKFNKKLTSLSSSMEATETAPSQSTSMDFSITDEDMDSEDETEYDMPPELPVEEEEWYYGDIERKVGESKCKTNGDYIVRYSERRSQFVLTCNWNGAPKHFVIQQITDENGKKMFRFESKSFSTIRTLLDYHVETGTAVTKASQAKILRPVPKHDKWSLYHRDITIGKKLGKGAFGDVFKADLNGKVVAVKSCRSDDLNDMDKFMQEADILKQYDHPNVVRLLGVCADKDPVYIVMEFMPGGALLDYLRKKGSQQTKKKLCSMCVDASRGMQYLESQHCIHRDLASRNCLVGDNDIIKISDFGMSREDEGGIYIVSSGTRTIPIKWTAPEALNYGKYSSPSDVWSFGILLWEVFSCGNSPYPGMSNHDARSQIEVGYRMPPPIDCPMEVYNVMQQCWQYDPEERPNFSLVLEMLTTAAENIS